MVSKKLCRPTTYVVLFWNKEGSSIIKEEVYPMYLYSFDDVTSKLKDNEYDCDIYEGRYWKKRGKYIVVGKTFVWDGFSWVVLP